MADGFAPIPRTPESTERRELIGSTVASVVIHVLGAVLLGAVVAGGADTLQVSRGIPVSLVEVAEPEPVVQAPREGAKPTQGEIRLPTHRAAPKTKPRTTRRPRTRPPREASATTEKPQVAAPAPPDPVKGAGGHMETEVPFPFDYYTETITQLVMSHWAPVSGALDSSRCVVRFQIERGGQVSTLEVDRSSGDAMFDGGALSAVRSVGTFPPLPQGFEWDRLKIRFHFLYRRGL